MSTYENPADPVLDTRATTWSNMGKEISEIVTKTLSKRSEVKYAALKAQQKADREYGERVLKAKQEGFGKLNEVNATAGERNLYMGVIDAMTTSTEAFRTAKTKEERSQASAEMQRYNYQMAQILDFAKSKVPFRDKFLNNNDPTDRNGEGQWAIEGIEKYGDWINYGQNWAANTVPHNLSINEAGELMLNIANPDNIEEYKSFSAVDFLGTEPNRIPKVSEQIQKRLKERGVLNAKLPGKLSDEYNEMSEDTRDAIIIEQILEPYAESIQSDTDATQAIWLNLLGGEEPLEYATPEEGRFMIQGSTLSQESFTEFNKRLLDYSKQFVPSSHPIPMPDPEETDATPNELAAQYYKTYKEDLARAWSANVNGEDAVFDEEKNIMYTYPETEVIDDETGEISKRKNKTAISYDFSKPGKYVDFINKLMLNSINLKGTSQNVQAIRSLIQQMAAQDEKDLYAQDQIMYPTTRDPGPAGLYKGQKFN
jgi:hypothetical protein